MTEQELIDLGFERVEVTPEQSGEEFGYHYYTMDIGTDFAKFCLISGSSDETDPDGWFVEIFQYGSFQFSSFAQTKGLIDILTSGLK